MDQRLKFASAAKCAGDRVVHRRYLPPDGLAQRSDRLLAMRSGSASRTATSVMAETSGATPGRARRGMARKPEQRQSVRRQLAIIRTMGRLVACRRAAGAVEGLLEHGVGYAEPEHEPKLRGDQRDQERRPRWTLLKRVDQPPIEGMSCSRGCEAVPRPPHAFAPGPAAARRKLDAIAGAAWAALWRPSGTLPCPGFGCAPSARALFPVPLAAIPLMSCGFAHLPE